MKVLCFINKILVLELLLMLIEKFKFDLVNLVVEKKVKFYEVYEEGKIVQIINNWSQIIVNK